MRSALVDGLPPRGKWDQFAGECHAVGESEEGIVYVVA